MTFKILVIGDPHLRIGALPRSHIMLQQVYKMIDQKKPNLIVCLGDVLDRFAHIHQEPLSMAIGMFTELQSRAPTYILVGNHDRPNNAVFLTDEHPFTGVHHWIQTPHPIKVIETPYIHKDIKSGYAFTFVPYTPEGRMQEALERIPDWKKSLVVFSHQDIRGGKYNNITNTTGDVWQSDYPLLINGHIHDYQNVGENIVFPGSPLQHAFNESPIKGLYWIEIKDSSKIHHERLLMNVPQLWTYHLVYEDIDGYEPPNLPEFSDMKLVIKGTVAQLKTLNKHPKIKKWQQRKIKIQQQVISYFPTKIRQDYKNHQQSFISLLHDILSNDEKTKELINLL